MVPLIAETELEPGLATCIVFDEKSTAREEEAIPTCTPVILVFLDVRCCHYDCVMELFFTFLYGLSIIADTRQLKNMKNKKCPVVLLILDYYCV